MNWTEAGTLDVPGGTSVESVPIAAVKTSFSPTVGSPREEIF